jgi:hypothetical protein
MRSRRDRRIRLEDGENTPRAMLLRYDIEFKNEPLN